MDEGTRQEVRQGDRTAGDRGRHQEKEAATQEGRDCHLQGIARPGGGRMVFVLQERHGIPQDTHSGEIRRGDASGFEAGLRMPQAGAAPEIQGGGLSANADRPVEEPHTRQHAGDRLIRRRAGVHIVRGGKEASGMPQADRGRR